MTYGALALVVVAVAAVVAVACAVRVRPSWRWWTGVALVALILIVLTAVFDSVMIAADLYRYEEAALSGLRIGVAPVEDFAWPLAAALLLPATWELLGSRRPPQADPGTGGSP
ncbi:lycopene cyclase domain-containing protein [Occultella kanbiaonis]|uniref:lycopene cyclase domain-containing protein n=1 Tax=Occultella kanbiaonis TaxID=2675754 RepID=UPI0012B75486|nr:lycopene cyclase domain-containing protein [Occultella kanbiaonis]